LQYRRPKKNIDGIILLDKPLGFSSNQALQKVKHLFQAAKAGHSGTLDPLATGLLPICLGEATKFVQYVTDADKKYIATIRFGETTTTGDDEGDVIEKFPVKFNQKDLEETCESFIGEISQIPPMYSALKFEGKALYEYARAGIAIERQARLVTIHQISVDAFTQRTATITVKCSKGTYIRTLAEDIAKKLQCGAHLIGLRRTETASFEIAQAITLETLIEKLKENIPLENLLRPVDAAISTLPSVKLDKLAAMQLFQGQTVNAVCKISAGEIRAYDEENKFLGVCQYENGKISPKRLVRTA